MYLRQCGFTYSAWWPFTKNKERIQKFKETRNSGHIYQNELDKASFQHDMVSGDYKNLTRKTASQKVLCDTAFNNAKNPKYGGYKRGFTSIVYKFWKMVLVVLLKMEICQTKN